MAPNTFQTRTTMTAYSFEPIGYIRSCFKEKFGIPRQPGLVPEALAELVILPGFQRREAFRGLENFSHIWLIFVFHQCPREHCKPTVRPPRLGGNRRIGVFATRSGFRPNPIGQSAVALTGIESGPHDLRLHLKGIDLLDGTPVLDIKPYVPYADRIADARAGYAQAPPTQTTVVFSDQADRTCRALEGPAYPELRRLIVALLSHDPRPAYLGNSRVANFGMRLWDLNIRFRIEAQALCVTAIEIVE